MGEGPRSSDQSHLKWNVTAVVGAHSGFVEARVARSLTPDSMSVDQSAHPSADASPVGLPSLLEDFT